MKEKIKSSLKTAYKDAGLSDKSLDRVVEYLETAISEETEIEDMVKSVGPMIKAFQSDADRVRAEKVSLEKKVKELEEKKPGEEGKPDPDKKGDQDQEPAWAKALREQNEKLAAKLAALDSEKIAADRKKQLGEIMAKAPAKLKERYEKDLGRMNFKDQEEFNSWIQEVKTDTEALIAETYQKGAAFGRPFGGGSAKGDDKPSPEIEARIKAREAETVAPAIKGLPETK